MWTDMDTLTPYMKNEHTHCTLMGARWVLLFKLTALPCYGSLSTISTKVGSLGVRRRGTVYMVSDEGTKELLGSQ